MTSLDNAIRLLGILFTITIFLMGVVIPRCALAGVSLGPSTSVATNLNSLLSNNGIKVANPNESRFLKAVPVTRSTAKAIAQLISDRRSNLKLNDNIPLLFYCNPAFASWEEDGPLYFEIDEKGRSHLYLAL